MAGVLHATFVYLPFRYRLAASSVLGASSREIPASLTAGAEALVVAPASLPIEMSWPLGPAAAGLTAVLASPFMSAGLDAPWFAAGVLTRTSASWCMRKPVPAGIRRPRMTFSFRPTR